MKDHDLIKKGIEIKGEDIREGLTAVLSVCVHEPQFQGQTKGRLNNPEVRSLVESMVRPRLEDFLLKNKSVGDAIAAAGDPGGQGPRGEPGRGQPGPPQDGDQQPAEPPRQAPRLRQHQPRGIRAVHRRGRLGRRLGQAGPRPRHPGDPAAQGQGPERRAGRQGQGARQQGADRHRQRPGLRHGRPVRPGPAPLRQGHPPDRRRQRRPPHRHAPADLLLPPPPRPVRGRPRLPRLPAALQDHLGQGDLLGGRRRQPRPILAKLPKNAKPNITRFKGLGEMPAQLLYETTLDPARRRLAPRRSSPTTTAPTPSAPSPT